jgi:hypothetical protein
MVDCVPCLLDFYRRYKSIPSYGMRAAGVEPASAVYGGESLCLRHFKEKAKVAP